MKTDQFDTALERANPVADPTPYGDSHAAALIDDITSGRIAGPASPPPATMGDPAGRNRGLVVGISLAAAAALAGILIVPHLREPAAVSPGATPTSAASGPATPSPTIKPTQYRKTVTKGLERTGETGPDGSSAHLVIPYTRTVYEPGDASKKAYEVTSYEAARVIAGTPHAPLARPHTVTHARLAGGSTAAPGYPGNWSTPMPSWIAGLPTEVDGLRARLSADAAARGTGGDASIPWLAVNGLTSGALPPDVRSRVLEVLSREHGVTMTQEKTSAVGVSALKVTIDAGGIEKQEMTFAADAPELLGLRAWSKGGPADGPDIPTPGVLVEDRRIVSREVVDAVPADIVAATREACDLTEPPSGGDVACDMTRARMPAPPAP